MGDIVSWVFLCWVTPVLRLGAQRPLESKDIPDTPPANGSRHTYEQLSREWEKSLSENIMPSLSVSILRAFKQQLLLSCYNFTFFLVVAFVQPLLVSKLLQYCTTGYVEIYGTNSGIAVALTLGVLSAVGALVFNHGFYYMQQFCLMTRMALISMLFKKSLSISSKARLETSTGEILTLMSVDVERVFMASLLCNWLVMGPVMCAVAIGLLYQEVGNAAFVVAGALLLWGYYQELIAEWIGNNRRKYVTFTAERTKLMNEILQGIRVIKYYAWEEACAKRVNSVREKELDHLSTYLLLKMANAVSCFVNYKVQPLAVSCGTIT